MEIVKERESFDKKIEIIVLILVSLLNKNKSNLYQRKTTSKNLFLMSLIFSLYIFFLSL